MTDDRQPHHSLLLLEVLGLHGSRHRLSINIESKSVDLRTELIDKLGYPPSPGNSQRMSNIMPVDMWDKILCRLTPKALCLLGGVCKFLQDICTAESLWLAHHKLLWRRDAMEKGFAIEKHKIADVCVKYLSRHPAAGDKDWDVHTRTKPMSSHRKFCERMNTRRRVRTTWQQLRKFAGGELARSSIQDGISEYEITLLEDGHGVVLPMQLRELYLVCNGEDETFGFGLHGQTGIINGLRFLPLEESIAQVENGGAVSPEASAATPAHPLPSASNRIPLTALAGFGSVGERYVLDLGSGEVRKISGMSEHTVGEDLVTFLETLLR